MTDADPLHVPSHDRCATRWFATALAVWAVVLIGSVFAFAWAGSAPGRPLSLGRAVAQATSAATLTGLPFAWSDPGGAAATVRLFVTGLSAWCCLTAATAALSGLRTRRPVDVGRLALLFGIGVIVLMLPPIVARSSSGDLLAQLPMAAAGAGAIGVDHESPRFWLLLTPIAAVGMLLPTLIGWRHGLAKHAIFTFAGMIGLLLLALLALWLTDGGVTTVPAAAIDARGAGLGSATVNLGRGGRVIAAVFAVVGSAGAGMATGGAAAVALLIVGVIRLLRGQAVGRTFAVALLWLTAMFSLWLGGLALLIGQLPQVPIDRLAVLAASAISGSNAAAEPVAASGGEAWALAALMIVGRVVSWMTMWFACTRGDEDVAIG